MSAVLHDSQGTAPGVLVRTYRGRTRAGAAQLSAADADRLAATGYARVSETWMPGSWGFGVVLIGILLFFVLIGVFVIIYLLLVRPQGTLTVTYVQQRAPEVAGPDPA